MDDQQLTCRDCGNTFIWTAGEQEFYKQKGFENQPTRCPDCRKKRKNMNFGGGGGRGQDRGPRQMFEIVCSNCGNKDSVPFKPREGRGVLCRDCFSKQRAEA